MQESAMNSYVCKVGPTLTFVCLLLYAMHLQCQLDAHVVSLLLNPTCN
jgi:hypothetical protein